MSVELTIEQSDPRNRKTYYFEMTPFRSVLTPTVRLAVKAFSKLEVRGVDNLPSSEPVVLVANHLTNFDVIYMQLAIPRPIFFMGKEEIFRNPFSDMILRQFGSFPVYRKLHDEWAMSHGVKVLERRLVLGIFPEGRRSRGQGLHEGKTGAARLAIGQYCPIVPMTVQGTEDVFKTLPRRAVIQIELGKPFLPMKGETPQQLTDRMMFTLANMLPSHMRGLYAIQSPG